MSPSRPPRCAVFTAEQAGYYKPRYTAFEYMLDQLDASPEDFVHVASHTRYDHQSMHDMGFRNLILLTAATTPSLTATTT
ncbi:hypothetical protein [Streptomyces coeruleorubidus]|uniref:hypothetical protein n=1 Tax=Streptomyces coeruleorubidus TaxID=116188 RepID=UPI0033FFD5CB